MQNITCEKSCMTFDGYTEDDHRIIVRDCGYFVSNECKDNQWYEGVAKGRICHCKGKDMCNHGSQSSFFATEFLCIPLSLLLANLFVWGWLRPYYNTDRQTEILRLAKEGG